MESTYYIARSTLLLEESDTEARHWEPPLSERFGENLAGDVLAGARQAFQALIPQIPHIGGKENPLTGALIDSARCLALYQAMAQHGRTAAETGKVLYDSILARAGEPAAQAPEERMKRRRKGAERSQARRYPGDYVYTFVPGDGEAFNYGYDLDACATQQLHHAQGTDAFLPFYCFLDFAWSRVRGLGLERTMTLAEGRGRCDHRFEGAGPRSPPGRPPSWARSRRSPAGRDWRAWTRWEVHHGMA